MKLENITTAMVITRARVSMVKCIYFACNQAVAAVCSVFFAV